MIYGGPVFIVVLANIHLLCQHRGFLHSYIVDRSTPYTFGKAHIVGTCDMYSKTVFD
jgi:hypothetical protein